jgi:hypothetical protein
MGAKKKRELAHSPKAMKKFLMVKAEELIAEAGKYAKTGDEVWTLTYLRSALSVVEAVRQL